MIAERGGREGVCVIAEGGRECVERVGRGREGVCVIAERGGGGGEGGSIYACLPRGGEEGRECALVRGLSLSIHVGPGHPISHCRQCTEGQCPLV